MSCTMCFTYLWIGTDAAVQRSIVASYSKCINQWLRELWSFFEVMVFEILHFHLQTCMKDRTFFAWFSECRSSVCGVVQANRSDCPRPSFRTGQSSVQSPEQLQKFTRNHGHLLWQWQHFFWFGLQFRLGHTCFPKRSWRNIHFRPPVPWWWCNCGGSAQCMCTIPLKIRAHVD